MPKRPPFPFCHQNVEGSTLSEHILCRMFLLCLFRRVAVMLAPGMPLSQNGKCGRTHPFVGFPSGKRTANNILGTTLFPQAIRNIYDLESNSWVLLTR